VYRRFEELPVWNDAIELACRVSKLAETGRLRGFADLRSQLERATLSISNNIAEGFERGTNSELLAFLYVARGSAGEARSMLHLLSRLGPAADSEPGVADLRARVESISRQFGGWIESIKDSGFQGSRTQNTKTRELTQSARRRDEFLARLQRIQRESHETKNAPDDPDPAVE
jgi:four helix bundle protein